MAISPICDYCNKELTEPGALVFAAPDEEGRARKYHACVGCFDRRLKPTEPWPPPEVLANWSGPHAYPRPSSKPSPGYYPSTGS